MLDMFVMLWKQRERFEESLKALKVSILDKAFGGEL